MDNCNKIRDLILTDYLDGQADLVVKQQVDGHLKKCSHCQAFAQEIKENLVVPFQGASCQGVPVELWRSIQERIQKEQYSKQNLLDNIKQWLDGFSTVRLMPALGSLMMLLFVGSTLLMDQQVKQVQDKQNDFNITDIYLSTWAYGQISSESSTPIEQYFL